jgi:spore germination protein KA
LIFDTFFHNHANRKTAKEANLNPDRQLINKTPDSDFPTANLAGNLELLRHELGSSPDLVVRLFQTEFQQDAAIIYINGLVAAERIESGILRPLIATAVSNEEIRSPKDYRGYLQARLTSGEIHGETDFNSVIYAILSGMTMLLIDGSLEIFLINTKGGAAREISEPPREFSIKGARDGFVESLDANLALLRRKIYSSKLRFELIKLGETAQTEIGVAYLQGVAADSLIAEIKRRLQAIRIDAVIDSGQVEELIRDSKNSPFPTIDYSERPDVVAAKIMEGRAAVFIAGTPIVLTAPMLFMERFQNPDDYNFNFHYATLIRWIRFTGFILTVFSPALYVALISYHPELIPTPLLITMAASAEGTPFPAVVEALGMGVIVELLREAGRWMPQATGSVVTILGLLVIGQALVSSGLVGAPFVIVVAITLVTSFLVPTQENVNPFLRLILVIFSGALGLYGLMLGFIIIYIHLASLRSFGVPYLTPLTPWNLQDVQDILIRAPWWALRRRPTLLARNNRIRQDPITNSESETEREAMKGAPQP